LAELDNNDDYGRDQPDQQQFFVGGNDWAFIQGVNEEYVDEIIDIPIIYYKILPQETVTNLYGESPEGEVYRPPFQIKVLITPEDQQTDRQNTGGPTKKQSMQFGIQREVLKKFDIYPEEGDVIQWSNLYFEVKEVVDNTLVGDKFNLRHAVTVRTEQTRISKINVIDPDEG
jgi:hypothetical protein